MADEVLHVVDMKYGIGVLVDAEHNPQMMCYALGAIDIYDGIYDIKTVKMTIFQPRRDNVSTCTMTKADLLTWADTVLPCNKSLHSYPSLENIFLSESVNLKSVP